MGCVPQLMSPKGRNGILFLPLTTMFYQVDYEKRRVLVQEVIDRLTRLDSEQCVQYLGELEALHEKYSTKSDVDAIGVCYYPTNKTLTK